MLHGHQHAKIPITMCGLYSDTKGNAALRELTRALEVEPLAPRYKVSPGTDAIVVRERHGNRRGDALRWGFRPTAERTRAPINARGESLFASSLFGDSALLRRCLVPADGFFEPRGPKRRGRAQFYFHLPKGAPFAMAGVWTDTVGESRGESFAIITTEPNDTVRPIHDRMPVILGVADFDAWLDPSNFDARTISSDNVVCRLALALFFLLPSPFRLE